MAMKKQVLKIDFMPLRGESIEDLSEMVKRAMSKYYGLNVSITMDVDYNNKDMRRPGDV